MTLLLLAGTRQARDLSREIADAGFPAIASLSGATRENIPLALPTRRGGFGGGQAFGDFLGENEIRGILDATHPFAARMSARTAEIAAARGVPYCQLLRPEWTPRDGDQWVMIPDEASAAAHIPTDATVFLATGRQTLPAFENLAGRRLICRQIDPPDRAFPFPNGEFLIGRPPFSIEQEITLFRELKVDWLIVKNAGGAESRSKLDAARVLGIPVAMISRPEPAAPDPVTTVSEAMDWVRELSWSDA